MISSGHYLATVVGLKMLERGANAIDAAGLAINVVPAGMTSLGGPATLAWGGATDRFILWCVFAREYQSYKVWPSRAMGATIWRARR